MSSASELVSVAATRANPQRPGRSGFDQKTAATETVISGHEALAPRVW